MIQPFTTVISVVDELTNTNRIFTRKCVESVIHNLGGSPIYGTVGAHCHVATLMDLTKVSHYISDMEVVDNGSGTLEWIGTVHVLNTIEGKILQAMLTSGANPADIQFSICGIGYTGDDGQVTSFTLVSIDAAPQYVYTPV